MPYEPAITHPLVPLRSRVLRVTGRVPRELTDLSEMARARQRWRLSSPPVLLRHLPSLRLTPAPALRHASGRGCQKLPDAHAAVGEPGTHGARHQGRPRAAPLSD